MKLRQFCVWILLVAGLGGATAQAQLGVYGTITGERVTGITCVDPQGKCASTDGTARPYGSSFGAYYDFRTVGPVRVGFDLRGSVLNTNKRADLYTASVDANRYYAVLGGVRATPTRTIFHLRPYAQASFGLGRTNVETSAGNPVEVYRNYSQVMAFAGADLPLGPVLDIRLIEFGAGALFGTATHAMQSVGIGVVFHGHR